MIYCSTKVDSKSLGWPSNPVILQGYIYGVRPVLRFICPGREKSTNGRNWKVDWLLGDLMKVVPPIPLQHGVGQGIRFPNDCNPHLIEPFQKLLIYFILK